MSISFKLKVHPSRLQRLASKYSDPREEPAFAAGSRLAAGRGGKSDFLIIFDWKTRGRGRSRACKNSEAEIQDAVDLALRAKTDRAAIAVLLGLQGVNVPVASATLTAMNQERFTVIDFRALEALSAKIVSPTVNQYLDYLGECRALAKKHGLSLREFDRALWQWSKDRSAEGT